MIVSFTVINPFLFSFIMHLRAWVTWGWCIQNAVYPSCYRSYTGDQSIGNPVFNDPLFILI